MNRADFLRDWDERTFELACDHGTRGLDSASRTELNRLVTTDELEELECVMASIHLAELSFVKPPADVMKRLHQSARNRTAKPAPPRRREPVGVIVTWLVTAAAALLLILELQSPGENEPSTAPAFQLRDRLVDEAGDLLTIDWTPNSELLTTDVNGRIDWSKSRQEGYMTFEGLEPNDPELERFQLWVFDQGRDRWDEHPVDGGVFDIIESGEVVVPISPRIPVEEAVLFAVTVEEPRGAVVSRRERLILTAGL